MNTLTRAKLEAIIMYDKNNNFDHEVLKASGEKSINDFYSALQGSLVEDEAEKLEGLVKNAGSELGNCLKQKRKEENEMTKEQARVVLNEFLAGKVWLSSDFTTNHDFDLSTYEIKQDIEQEVKGMGCVHLTFLAKPHYVEALERYNENPTEENGWMLQEITEGDFEDFYDYDKPTKIEWASYSFGVVGGKVI